MITQKKIKIWSAFTVSTNHTVCAVKEHSQVTEKQEIWAGIYLTTDSSGYFSAPDKSAQTGNNKEMKCQTLEIPLK